ncbi:hypothetical protein [Nostoc sp. NMS4]|uniref:hypothetical protein n=1 Tax=Nostoc sp. NMS4 TaxID=2815390 RepID=UPI0026004F28|nr:hypothetical protein [Nostoc sp. NMS4]MBN3926113.1 hypothetical protein [Nostoc sp. NMS4]
MAEPTIVQIFGTGATRLASGATTATTGLFIPDSALTAAGLATPSTATAEGHFVALLLAAKAYLTQSNFDANTDQSLLLADGFSSFTTRGTDNYRQDQITVSLSKIDTSSTIDPDNY